MLTVQYTENNGMSYVNQNVFFKEDLDWFSVFMLIRVLFLPTTSETSSNADVSTAVLQSSLGQTSIQYKNTENLNTQQLKHWHLMKIVKPIRGW